MALISLYFFNKSRIFLSALIIAFLGFIKIFPLALIIAFFRSAQRKKFIIFVIISLLTLLTINFIFCPIEWNQAFLERILIPWDAMPKGDLDALPENLGVIKNSMMVMTSDARNLFHSHFFVFGFANPLLSDTLFLSGIIGSIGAFICLFKYSNYSTTLCFLTIMNWINIINPISWIMGLIWYTPLFIYSFDKVRSSYKIVLILPLILPPFLNASGYIAAIISLFILKIFTKESIKQIKIS